MDDVSVDFVTEDTAIIRYSTKYNADFQNKSLPGLLGFSNRTWHSYISSVWVNRNGDQA